MRVMKGLSEMSPSNVMTMPSFEKSTSPTGRRRWSWSAIEIIWRTSGKSSPCRSSSSRMSTVSKTPVSRLMTSAFLGE